MLLPPRLYRTALGRADLLRLLRGGLVDADHAAALCGFEARQPPRVAAVPPPDPPETTAAAPTAPPVVGAEERAVRRATHFLVTHSVEPAADANAVPDLDHGPIIEGTLQSDPRQTAPMPERLVPRRRLATLVRKCLRRPAPSRQLDVARWVHMVSRGAGLPARLPRRALPRWGAGAGLVINGHELSEPLHADLMGLAQDASTWSAGAAGIYWRDPQGRWLVARSQRNRATPGGPAGLRWQPLPGGVPASCRHWLWAGVSAHGPAADGGGWSAPLAHVLRRRGSVVWLHADSGLAPPQRLPAGVKVVPWDRGAGLQPRQRTGHSAVLLPMQPLLSAMSMAVRVEPALLRALRLELGLPIAAEVQAWSHPDVEAHGIACMLAAEGLPGWRARAVDVLPLPLRQRLARLVAQHHRHLSPLIRMEEQALTADLAPGAHCDDTLPGWLDAARTLRQQPGSAAAQALASYVRRTGARAHAGLWNEVPGLAEAWVLAERDVIAEGAPLPEGLSPQTVLHLGLGGAPASAGEAQVSLVQRGSSLWLVPGLFLHRLATLPMPTSGIVVEDADGVHWLPWHTRGVCVLRALGSPKCSLHLRGVQWHVQAVQRPAWATEWGRDVQGLYALAPPLGAVQRRVDASHLASTGEWRGPPQALAYGASVRLGLDAPYGFYADVVIGKAVQRLRWIPPGTFTMGSDDEERARITDPDWRKACRDESPSHTVHLTQGLWLADTACTQALWLQVMGSNPSHFNDDLSAPVEQISLGDVRGFLERLQLLLWPGVKPGLPTEAEWEYACRAGSRTAYSHGNGLSREQACFGDADDFGFGDIHMRPDRTSAVKSYPPNDWGLYEMHGNVFEWCADVMRRYGRSPISDPNGLDEAGPAGRLAVRGGSWVRGARYARSAYRSEFRRDDRDPSLGFRWCLRSTGPTAPVSDTGDGTVHEPPVSGSGNDGQATGGAPGFWHRIVEAVRPTPVIRRRQAPPKRPR